MPKNYLHRAAYHMVRHQSKTGYYRSTLTVPIVLARKFPKLQLFTVHVDADRRIVYTPVTNEAVKG
jgi:hypothetical protein